VEALITIFESSSDVRWDYDEGADVLYLSVGEPRLAVGVAVGEGVIARYDEERNEVVGVTLVGLRARLLRELDQNH